MANRTGGDRRMRSQNTRNVPPLIIVSISLVFLLSVLPSALSLPQSNPSETLEYAPVPPEDDTEPPPNGNLSALGLGTSGSFGTGEGAGTGEGPGGAGEAPAATGVGKNPSTKRCVGNPPRQTEDELSPPCVAYFSGDNFGATYQGVSRDEIQLLFYFQSGYNYSHFTGEAETTDPASTYYDLGRAPEVEREPVFVRNLRRFQRYFNERYQTYGRFAHFHAYYSSTHPTAVTVESRRADAAENYNKIRPFAVVSFADLQEEEYLDVMARKGVLTFGSKVGLSESFYQRFPKLVWGFLPTVERQARQWSTYVCRQVIGHPVSFAGEAAMNGGPRKLGFLRTDNPARPGMIEFARLAKEQIEACGGEVLERTFTQEGVVAPRSGEAPSRATLNISDFQSNGITTILWAQGYEVEHTKAAARANYRPEWILAGDGALDGYNMAFQDQSVFDGHAWVVTNQVLSRSDQTDGCFQSQREADPEVSAAEAEASCFYPMYENLRQMFTGIQVAGPRLSPASVDHGFHAIPPHSSSSPTKPACFYEPGEYTCVKDAAAMWWNASTVPPGEQSAGCWHMAEGGRRYLPKDWHRDNVDSRKRADDPCNVYAGVVDA